MRGTFFELIQIEGQCKKKLFQKFLSQEARAFGNNRKQTAKATSKIEEICMLYIYREYLLCVQSIESGNFLQRCINFVEQRVMFSHFKSRIIP